MYARDICTYIRAIYRVDIYIYSVYICTYAIYVQLYVLYIMIHTHVFAYISCIHIYVYTYTHAIYSAPNVSRCGAVMAAAARAGGGAVRSCDGVGSKSASPFASTSATTCT